MFHHFLGFHGAFGGLGLIVLIVAVAALFRRESQPMSSPYRCCDRYLHTESKFCPDCGKRL